MVAVQALSHTFSFSCFLKRFERNHNGLDESQGPEDTSSRAQDIDGNTLYPIIDQFLVPVPAR